MDKKYYYSDGNQTFGPFSLDELANQKISPSTIVWYDGLQDWQAGGELSELATLFPKPPPLPRQTTPPPIPNQSRATSTSNAEVKSKDRTVQGAPVLVDYQPLASLAVSGSRNEFGLTDASQVINFLLIVIGASWVNEIGYWFLAFNSSGTSDYTYFDWINRILWITISVTFAFLARHKLLQMAFIATAILQILLLWYFRFYK